MLESLTKVIFIFHDGMVLQCISSQLYARTAKLVLAKTETDLGFFNP